MASSICFQALCRCSDDSDVLAASTIFRPRVIVAIPESSQSQRTGQATNCFPLGLFDDAQVWEMQENSRFRV
jgi:hypothetical protein